MAKRRQSKKQLQAEVHRLQQESSPYIELAREIQDNIARIAMTGTAQDAALVELFDSIGREARQEAARNVFSTLSLENRWHIIATVFSDDEIKTALELQHESLHRQAARKNYYAEIAREAQEHNRLDLLNLDFGVPLVLGLFRSAEVAQVVRTGKKSQICARRLSLLSTNDKGVFQVINDEFNPHGSFRIGADYNEEIWRKQERFDGHSLIRPGFQLENSDSLQFQSALYVESRVDFQSNNQTHTGLLSLGYAVVGDYDVFTES
ncbi:MAG: hypothetical protein JWS12_782 [Candidatus Saccharibacteria bacterium]|nr:hypothetical protein [Candidatus Saccharibacteria bacterium]